MADHDRLIEKLSRDMTPVKRMCPAGGRVFIWLAIALPCGAAASLLVHRTLIDWSSPGMAGTILQLLLTFFTGTLAIHNAFKMSIAGRYILSWRWFIPLVVFWLGSNLLHLRDAPMMKGHADETNCYLFILVVSVPMMLMMIGSLRQTRTLYPVRNLTLAGAGVACMALSLLSLCHPVELYWLDLLQHLAAVFTVVLLTIILGHRWVVLP